MNHGQRPIAAALVVALATLGCLVLPQATIHSSPPNGGTEDAGAASDAAVMADLAGVTGGSAGTVGSGFDGGGATEAGVGQGGGVGAGGGPGDGGRPSEGGSRGDGGDSGEGGDSSAGGSPGQPEGPNCPEATPEARVEAICRYLAQCAVVECAYQGDLCVTVVYAGCLLHAAEPGVGPAFVVLGCQRRSCGSMVRWAAAGSMDLAAHCDDDAEPITCEELVDD